MTRLVFALIVASTLAMAAAPVQDHPVSGLDIELRARAFEPGEVLVVSIAVQATAATPELRIFDAPVSLVRVHPHRWEAVAGIDLDRAPGEYAVTVFAAGESVTKTFRVASRRFPTRTLKVNPDFVHPPKSVAARIESESRLVANAYQSSAPERLWSEPFVRPVPQPANSSFGTRSVFNGEPRASHGGTDFLSPSGTPIRAPNDGHVLVARPLYFAGGSVLIDHGAGLFSQMAHLSRIDVKEGQAVHRGEVVGLVGATGRVTGAHLHWAVRAAGARVDALSLLAVLGKE